MARYPWGNEPFTMPGMLGCLVFGGLLIGIIVFTDDGKGALGDQFPAPKDLHKTVGVMCGYAAMLYIFLGHQVQIKMSNHPLTEPAQYIATRAVGNLLEQAVPFVTFMFLSAIFVDPQLTWKLGTTYVVFRFIYPFAWGIYGTFTNLIEVGAQVNYTIVWYFVVTVFFKCIVGYDLRAKINETSNVIMIFLPIAFGLLNLILFIMGGTPGTKVILAGVTKFERRKVGGDQYLDEYSSSDE